ncbi:MAG: hypothetical protein B7Z55_01150 [Planctomycetales bacterium 12-60-4]|nr:MAG: hypothetical protein B7Z55_01150 [Planctomycetales bacterium 12-60-4]
MAQLAQFVAWRSGITGQDDLPNARLIDRQADQLWFPASISPQTYCGLTISRTTHGIPRKLDEVSTLASGFAVTKKTRLLSVHRLQPFTEHSQLASRVLSF